MDPRAESPVDVAESVKTAEETLNAAEERIRAGDYKPEQAAGLAFDYLSARGFIWSQMHHGAVQSLSLEELADEDVQDEFLKEFSDVSAEYKVALIEAGQAGKYTKLKEVLNKLGAKFKGTHGEKAGMGEYLIVLAEAIPDIGEPLGTPKQNSESS